MSIKVQTFGQESISTNRRKSLSCIKLFSVSLPLLIWFCAQGN